MSETNTPAVGTLAGFDLTVDDAPAIRDFYASVIGWDVETLDVEDHQDYVMKAPGGGDWVAGVCHRLGPNADLPPLWIVYVYVADLGASMRRCVEGGGKVLAGPKGSGDNGRYCVIQDPAGAVLALMQRGGS
ncbi:MAG TPA: VOC family protein [Thermomicrobiales bacterium]|nr:VOC family protein [Thermomicrobiales bacterium]